MTSKDYAPAMKVAAAAKATTTKAAGAAKATTFKAANSAMASLPFDLPKFDLPKFELPKVDVLNLNFSAMATSARTRVETTTTDVRNSVNHGVTLLREVVGI
jgi:hypothetical protein